MKRKLFFICFLSIVCVVSMAQNITKFYFDGYRVVVIPSEEFRIDVKHPELGEKKIKGNALSLKLIDAEGKMPKDTVIVYTNAIREIRMDYSVLAMEKAFTVDSLNITLGSSHGAIAVDANYLNISLNAASNLVVAGKCKKLRTRTNGKGNALNLDSFLVESRE